MNKLNETSEHLALAISHLKQLLSKTQMEDNFIKSKRDFSISLLDNSLNIVSFKMLKRGREEEFYLKADKLQSWCEEHNYNFNNKKSLEEGIKWYLIETLGL